MSISGKASIFFWGFFMFVYVGTLQATDTPMLERTITISLRQERIDVALKKIAEQGGFIFSYNPSIIDGSQIVNKNFAGKTIREVLNELFDGSISYKERKKYIILTKATAKDARLVKGYIIDEKTGEHLKNVSVYDPVTLKSVVTDSYGYFQIKVDKPTTDLILSVNKENYSDTVVAVSSWRGLLKIPIKNSKEKILTMTDSVRMKFKRFWKTKFIANENLANISDTLYRKFQFSIFPFVGTNHKLSGNVINDYSFNIYGGYSRGVRVLEIGGTFNTVGGDVHGAQIAGSFNGVKGKVKGVQISGGVNANRDSVQGAQAAGLINLNWNSVKFFSAAGLLNVTHNTSSGTVLAGLGNVTLGEQHGAHIAGLFNASTKNTKSLQLCGLVNFTHGDLRGAQIAGLTNVAVGDVKGVQTGGLTNFAFGTMKGAQVSGLINYAKRVEGVQFGFLNFADSVKGISFGFLSFVAKGYHKIEISADEIFYTNLAFRTGTHRFYNIFTAGMKPQNSKNNYWTFGYGLGTAPKLTPWLSMNIDVTSNQVSYGEFTQAINLLNKFYIGLDVRMTKGFSVALGATLNGYLTDTTYHGYTNLFTDYKPKVFSDHTFHNDINMKMWLGGKVALRFF
jgi:hypothetical protein